MDRKKPTILLIEDNLDEYNNWKKWINFNQSEANLLYASDLDIAIQEVKKNQVDIYIIDLHLKVDREGNDVLGFLNIIRNKRGLKIALTNSVDNIDYLEKLYEFGAIPITVTKSDKLKEPMRAAELVFSLYNLGLSDEYDEDDFTSMSSNLKTEILNDVSTKLNTVSNQVNKLQIDFKEMYTELTTMKIYLLGDYQAIGLKSKVADIEQTIEELKQKNDSALAQLLNVINTSPFYIKFLILVFAGILIVTLPLILIHKITGS